MTALVKESNFHPNNDIISSHCQRLFVIFTLRFEGEAEVASPADHEEERYHFIPLFKTRIAHEQKYYKTTLG